MAEKRQWLATLKLEVEPEVFKRVVEEGRLSEFVDTFPALAAGHMKAQIVEQLATGELGEILIRYDDEFGTGPRPLPVIDTVPLPESRLRRIVREELERGGTM